MAYGVIMLHIFMLTIRIFLMLIQRHEAVMQFDSNKCSSVKFAMYATIENSIFKSWQNANITKNKSVHC